MSERFVNDRCLAATARYMALADEAGIHPVTLATAWSKQHDFVASTIVGVTSLDQVAPILAAADLSLSDDLMKAINQVNRDIPYPMG
jgi:aryl-alcohol dehydrogenase-like predicted oxidoreductase